MYDLLQRRAASSTEPKLQQAALRLHRSPRGSVRRGGLWNQDSPRGPFPLRTWQPTGAPGPGASQPTPEQALCPGQLSDSSRLPTAPPSLNIAFSFLLFKAFDIFQSKIFLSMNLGKGRGLSSADYCFPPAGRQLCSLSTQALSTQVLAPQHSGSS